MDVYAQEKQNFLQHFSQIVKMLTEDDTEYLDTREAVAWLKEVLKYSAIRGKYQQGLTVLITSQSLVELRKLDTTVFNGP